MVRLVTAAGPVEARILAARLGSEGIVWEFRGSVDGPFAVGPIEILVDSDGLDSARALLVDDDLESSFSDTIGADAHVTTGRDVLWAALALLGLMLFTIALAVRV